MQFFNSFGKVRSVYYVIIMIIHYHHRSKIYVRVQCNFYIIIACIKDVQATLIKCFIKFHFHIELY